MENKIVVANLKMNMDMNQVKQYLDIIENKINSQNIIICPSNIYIPYFLNKDFLVGVQNLHDSLETCTGEISAHQLDSMNIRYSIVGHSERKKYFNESDITINKKIKIAIENNITPIICIGETKEEKDAIQTNEVLKKQIKNYLVNINSNNLYIAYEPVWSIGTKEIYSEIEIEKTIDYIKSIAKELYNIEAKVLYGGSIDEENIKKLNKISSLDGFLIGTSSMDAMKFLKLIEVVV